MIAGPGRRRLRESKFTKSTSGSDLPKLQQQLPEEILHACEAVFTCSGAERWQDGELVSRNAHEFPSELITLCEEFVAHSQYPERHGNHIEHRTGMLNVSAVCRNASTAQRHAYFEWDKRAKERVRFVEQVNAAPLAYEASAGGEISIDIVPHGWNKAVVFDALLAEDHERALMFFGDRIEEGGNDRPLAQALWSAGAPHEVRQVTNWSQTFHQLLLEVGTCELAA